MSFNTSHVTLYHRGLRTPDGHDRFQYISCYSLSAFSATTLSDFCVSIHLMLLFIAVRGGEDFPGTVVSIHLMLLFIEMDLETYPKKKDVSIHLMLLFIPSLGRHEDLIRMFQYISSYSLSAVAVDMRVLIIGFNTSHVTLYRCCDNACDSCCRRFNTSHVTLYRCCDNACDSCCRRFNTSHVTLYLSRNVLVTIAYEFQYISCYSLSADDNATPVLSAMFQYISCYSLS